MRSSMKFAKAITVGLLLGFCLLAGACSDDPPQEKQLSGKVEMPASAPVQGQVAKVTPRPLFVELLVNERPAARQTPDLPVIVTVTFANPHKAMALPLPGLGWLKPFIRAKGEEGEQGGGKPILEWTAPGLKTASLDPGQRLRLSWVLRGVLPEGAYRLGLRGLDGLVEKNDASISALRLTPAILEIIPGTADPKLAAYWERKAVALTKGPQAWLDSLDRALGETPGNPALRYEKVQALTALNRPEQAHEELAGLMLEARRKLSGKKPDGKTHLPYYYYQGLADLRRLAERKQKSP